MKVSNPPVGKLCVPERSYRAILVAVDKTIKRADTR